LPSPSSSPTSHFAQPLAPLFPPPPPVQVVDERLVLQIKLMSIDGTRAALTQSKGFRNLVQSRCQTIGLSGFVWRVPRVDGKILARGTRDQLKLLLDCLDELRVQGFIQNFLFENRQDYLIATDVFSTLPSNRPRVITGAFSDPDLDDVTSTHSAANAPLLGGSPR